MSTWTEIKKSVFPLKGFLIISLLKLMNWLPDRLTGFLGGQLGLLAYHLSEKRRRVILPNLKIAFLIKQSINESYSLNELVLPVENYYPSLPKLGLAVRRKLNDKSPVSNINR